MHLNILTPSHNWDWTVTWKDSWDRILHGTTRVCIGLPPQKRGERRVVLAVSGQCRGLGRMGEQGRGAFWFGGGWVKKQPGVSKQGWEARLAPGDMPIQIWAPTPQKRFFKSDCNPLLGCHNETGNWSQSYFY